MRKTAPCKTNFYALAGEFKDTYTAKWKSRKMTRFSRHTGTIANSILSNILIKGL